MVDSPKGVSSIQNIQAAGEKRADASREKRETRQAERAEDTVEVSEDAQVLAKLSETRVQVANSDLILGLDPDFAKTEA